MKRDKHAPKAQRDVLMRQLASLSQTVQASLQASRSGTK